MFLAPIFLDLYYRTKPTSDDVAKIHGDRPRELRDVMAKEKRINSSKT